MQRLRDPDFDRETCLINVRKRAPRAVRLIVLIAIFGLVKQHLTLPSERSPTVSLFLPSPRAGRTRTINPRLSQAGGRAVLAAHRTTYYLRAS